MSIIIGTVTINRNPSFGTQWWSRRLNQSRIETADGGFVVVDNGPDVVEGVLVLVNVDKTEAESLRTYLTGTAVYCKNSFTMTPPANTDLGNGNGTAITVNLFSDPTMGGIFDFIAPGMYNIRLPYRKVNT